MGGEDGVSEHKQYNCNNDIAGGAETLACGITDCRGREWFDKAGTLEKLPTLGSMCMCSLLPSFHCVPCHIALEEGFCHMTIFKSLSQDLTWSPGDQGSYKELVLKLEADYRRQGQNSSLEGKYSVPAGSETSF